MPTLDVSENAVSTTRIVYWLALRLAVGLKDGRAEQVLSKSKSTDSMIPLLKRVLIADPNTGSTRLISGIIRDVLRSHVWTAPTTDRALKLANNVNPDIIFVEFAADGLDGLGFTRQLRKGEFTCRKAPVVMVTGNATSSSILAAREAGVHEFLCKPFSLKDLIRRMEAVTLRQRDWVESMDYIGPDRRRFNSGDYAGPRKRKSDPGLPTDQERLDQALKILRNAILTADRDPAQALRCMLAQAQDIKKVAIAMADGPLAQAAVDLHDYLDLIVEGASHLDATQLARQASKLLRCLPAERTKDVRVAA